MKNTKKSLPLASAVSPLGRARRGAGMVEYGMLAGLVAVASIVAVSASGTRVADVFCQVTSSLNDSLEMGLDIDCPENGQPGVSLAGPVEGPGTGTGPTTGPVNPPAPEGTDGREFISVEFPMHSRGEKYIWMNRGQSAIIDAGDRLRLTGGNSDISVCYKEFSSSEPVCDAANSYFPEGVAAVGWRADLPEETRLDWATNFSLLAYNGTSMEQRWDLSATRVTAPIVLEPTFDFEDFTLVAGTTGTYELMVDMTGQFNGEMRFKINQHDTSSHSVCVQDTPASEIRCVEANNGTYANLTDIPKDAARIGYRVEFTDPPTIETSVSFYGNIQSKIDSSVRHDFAWTGLRPAEPVQLNPGFSFPDEALPASFTGTHTVERRFTGTFNSPMRFKFSGDVTQGCIKADAFAEWDCRDQSPASFVISPTTYALRYTVDLGDENRIAQSHDIELTVYSTTQRDVEEVWDVNVSKPATPIIHNPTFLVADQNFGGDDWQTVMFAYTGDFNGDTRWGVRSHDTTRLRACIQSDPDAEIECKGATSSWTSEKIPEDTYRIGYMVDVPDGDWETTLHAYLRSDLDSSVRIDYTAQMQD